MTPNNKDLNILFDKFIAGIATADEKALLWKWMYLLDARQQQIIYSRRDKELIRETMRNKILEQMKPVPGRHVSILRYSVAAAVIILIATGAFWFISGGQKNNQPVASVVNAGDKMRTFYLPDSTQVVLNMASTLEWNDQYNTTDRKVILKGEGYFNVHKDKARPFIVESKGILTRALGTAFNIEAYHQESEVRVALLEGSVEVRSNRQVFAPAVLQPGQLLRFQHNSTAVQVQPIAGGDAIAWTTGGMSFHAIPLSEALDRLARRYNLTIQYDKKQLQSKMVSGSFKPSRWQQLLPNILFIHNLRYEAKNNHVRVY